MHWAAEGYAYARNREAEPGDEDRRGHPGRGRKMQPAGIRDSPLRTTKTRKDRTRQASAIRSELLMTSLLSGALETDSEFSFYLPRSALTGLSISTGVPYDPKRLLSFPPAFPIPPPDSLLVFAGLVKYNWLLLN